MTYTFEKNKLYAYLGDELVDLLKMYKCVVAGGTLTSLFCNREINDIDVYFKCEEDAIGFIADVWGSKSYIYTHTKKATLMKVDEVDIQVIHFDYFNSVQNIFDTFDFTVCMAAYDFEKEEFILHDDFLKHNSQRILKFNSGTKYPIVSMLRIQKYQEKGYTISKPEYIRMILTCMNTDIKSYEDLMDQLGGMYGINYDKLFEDVKDEEFDLQTAIDKIANITLSEDYFKQPMPIEFHDLDDLLENISTRPVKWFELKNKLYKIDYRGLLNKIHKEPKNGLKVTPEEFFSNTKFYKYVKKEEGKYFSFQDKNFEYKIGDMVEAKGNISNYSGEGKLHFCEFKNLDSATYKNKTDGVLIEVIIHPDHLIDVESHITARKCIVLREVPKEEYEKYTARESRETLGFTLNLN